MNVLTDIEVLDFVAKHAWATGLHANEPTGVYYQNPDARCLRLTYPERPLRVTYAARLLAMLGTGSDEALFSGALLWLRLWNIGSAQLEKSGWKIMERMRMGYGELRPLGVANAHWFRADEVTDLAAFIVPCFVYGWDAYVIPSNAGCFAFISHDEFWCLTSRDDETRKNLTATFAEFNPQIDDQLAPRFCLR